MVHFFGILQPGMRANVEATEAPYKTDFFGDTDGADPDRLSRAERDALILSGKADIEQSEHDEDDHLIRTATSLFF